MAESRPPAQAVGAPGLLADEQTDLVLRALATKPRREILAVLAAGTGGDDERCASPGEVCACVFAERLGIGAPTVSHHMKTLVEAGLVASEKRGTWVYYRLRPEAIRHLVGELNKLVSSENGACS
jgi:DNA-binding transcriptional ArsR family regulator